MASLDTLPPDQRAVLQLVLQRGRSYDQIADMLAIDRAGVRQRALAAFDALGPNTRVPAERRALITDYLLGQLPEQVSEQTRTHLGASASERAWARVLASELMPIARDELPEIPASSEDGEPHEETEPVEDVAAQADGGAATAVGEREDEDGAPAGAAGSAAAAGPTASVEERPGAVRPASRRGGAMLLGAVALVVVIVLVIVLATSGGSSNKKTATSSASASSSSAASSSAATGTNARLVAQVNLTSPTPKNKTAGLAQVIRQGPNLGLVIVAQSVPANTSHNAYAVWLYNSATDSRILGFVNPGVKRDGRLQTSGVLPSNASHYKQLLLTLETRAKPRTPGTVVLQGSLKVG